MSSDFNGSAGGAAIGTAKALANKIAGSSNIMIGTARRYITTRELHVNLGKSFA